MSPACALCACETLGAARCRQERETNVRHKRDMDERMSLRTRDHAECLHFAQESPAVPPQLVSLKHPSSTISVYLSACSYISLSLFHVDAPQCCLRSRYFFVYFQEFAVVEQQCGQALLHGRPMSDAVRLIQECSSAAFLPSVRAGCHFGFDVLISPRMNSPARVFVKHSTSPVRTAIIILLRTALPAVPRCWCCLASFLFLIKNRMLCCFIPGLQDVQRRPPQPREAGFQPPTLFQLDEKQFGRNLRSARRGVAGGPSGMTCEHLRPLLDEGKAMQLLFKVGENLARAHVPEVAVSMVRSGRLTALSKPDGGVRGFVSGDVIRRLVTRTIAQQLGEAVKTATAPHQYVLSTRAGCECVAHPLQGLCELNPFATVTSIGGPCWKDWHKLTEVQPPFPSCACSTVPHPSTCGMTTTV